MASDNSEDLFSVAMLIDELKVRSTSSLASRPALVVRPGTTRRQKVTDGVFRPLVWEKNPSICRPRSATDARCDDASAALPRLPTSN